jgi:hypothetical protein
LQDKIEMGQEQIMDSVVFKQAGKKLDYCDNQQIKGNYFIGFFFLPVIF